MTRPGSRRLAPRLAFLAVALLACNSGDSGGPSGQGLNITTTTLPGGQIAVAYAELVEASGGTAPYTWQAIGLPPGLQIGASNGIVSGIPLNGLSTGFTAIVTDAADAADTQVVQLSIPFDPILNILSTTLDTGAVSVPYLDTLKATGGRHPYAWSVSGLPAGLNLAAATGIVTGVPSATHSGTLAFIVSDSLGRADTQLVQLTIGTDPPLNVLTTTLSSGTVGLVYADTLNATGGRHPYTWTTTGLPSGLGVNASTGVVSGTPGAVHSAPFTAIVTDSVGRADTQLVQLPVYTLAHPNITTTALPPGQLTVPYSQSLAATGGTPPYSWSATGLPTGLSVAAATGVVSGTPTAPSSAFTAIVVDSVGSADTQAVSLFIPADSTLTIVTTAISPGSVGVPYADTLFATGGRHPYVWSSFGLPAGVTLDATTGIVAGTPAGPHTGPFTAIVTDSLARADTQLVQLSIPSGGPPQISQTVLSDAYVGVPYADTLFAAGGAPPYQWSVSALAPGLNLVPATGVISGTPTAVVATVFSGIVTDSKGRADTSNMVMTVHAAGATRITTTSLPAGVISSPYSAPVNATGGDAAYSWSASKYPSTAGISINNVTGTIGGAPTYPAGRYLIVVHVTGGSTSDTKTFPVDITAASGLAVTSDTLPSGVGGVPYSTTLQATGGSQPYTWTLTTPNSGVSYGMTVSTDGTFSGTPLGSTDLGGSDSVGVLVTDAVGASAFRVLHWAVALGPVQITQASFRSGILGVQYSDTLHEVWAVDGGPGHRPHWSIVSGALPPGLGFNDGSLSVPAQLTGTPTAVGTYPFTVLLTDFYGRTDTASYSITITAAPPVITTATLPDATATVAYSVFPVATGGVPPYVWTLKAGSVLPTGFSLTPAGHLAGTTTQTGAFPISLIVTDSLAHADTANYTLTVNP